MSRQVKEDEMVFHKNWIFRKCRHVALVAYCKIHQVLRILSDHLRRRTAQILAAFRTRMACNAIVKSSRRWLSRCTLYKENNFRHTFTFVSRYIESTKRFEQQSREILKSFLQDSAKKFYMKRNFARTMEIILWTQATLREILNQRRE